MRRNCEYSLDTIKHYMVKEGGMQANTASHDNTMCKLAGMKTSTC